MLCMLAQLCTMHVCENDTEFKNDLRMRETILFIKNSALWNAPLRYQYQNKKSLNKIFQIAQDEIFVSIQE
ncbi:CLUMA_CG000899, isoform A [Clunio marinus]|uniref:CLUMA_CG000899, isoform A n=1 Tax=Clunio marinus TaxID=568069 RepID=A0A1J1HLG1_9DIPT|nr:CLUMA_CG000899, isoform A [Clunio marinus]